MYVPAYLLLFCFQVAAISAMRNVVSRSRHLTAAFVELEVESLLHETAALHSSANDGVKAALRDMGLKVHLKEEWTGVTRTTL